MMRQVFNPIANSSDRPSITFRKSQLLAVQAFRNKLGSQNALLLQVTWFQISNLAQYSSDELRWPPLLRV